MGSYCKEIDLEDEDIAMAILGRIEDIVYEKYDDVNDTLEVEAQDESLIWDSERGVFICDVVVKGTGPKKKLKAQTYPYKLFEDAL